MFKFKNAEFITSAVSKKQWLNDDKLEFCLLGRSNVGKSTFINFLTNRNKLAKVSSAPGKTRMLNFFSINNNSFRIVDAPGYGFSRISNDIKVSFYKLMEEYLVQRENLVFVALLLDLRRVPNSDDIDIYNFLKFHKIKVIVIGTKLDKLKRNDIKKNVNIIKRKINFNDADYFVKISSFAKLGKDEC